MYISFFSKNNNEEIQSKNEGVGGQYQRIVALLSIAKRHNLKYIHIPY